MARVHVAHSIGDLVGDLRTIRRQVRPDGRKAVLSALRLGNKTAQGLARVKNDPDSHSRLYPGTFSAAMHGGAFGGGSLFGNVISGEYGPRPRGQGLLAPILENGSRSGNAPQQNLARSADRAGEALQQNVRTTARSWFWPES